MITIAFLTCAAILELGLTAWAVREREWDVAALMVVLALLTLVVAWMAGTCPGQRCPFEWVTARPVQQAPARNGP